MFCGYVAAPTVRHHGKRKKADLPSAPPPAKTSFRSTECLLLSLLRQGTCDETESPMREVLSGKLQSRVAALTGGSAGEGQLGGSCGSLSTVGSSRCQTRTCSLETILDDSAPLTRQQLFLSTGSLTTYSNGSQEDGPAITAIRRRAGSVSTVASVRCDNAPGSTTRKRLSLISGGGLSHAQRCHPLRPRSIGSCLDIVMETREEDVKDTQWQGLSTSCLNLNTPAKQHHSSTSHPPLLPSTDYHPFSPSAMAKAQGSAITAGPAGPRPAYSTSNLWTLSASAVVRRCLSSVDVSKPPRPALLLRPPFCVPSSSSKPPHPKPEHSKTLYPCVCLSVDV